MTAAQEVPAEILVMIFQDLGFTDLDHCCDVCHKWQNVIRSRPDLCERLFLQPVQHYPSPRSRRGWHESHKSNYWKEAEFVRFFEEADAYLFSKVTDGKVPESDLDARDGFTEEQMQYLYPRMALLNPVLALLTVKPLDCIGDEALRASGRVPRIVRIGVGKEDEEAGRHLTPLLKHRYRRWLNMLVSQPPITELMLHPGACAGGSTCTDQPKVVTNHTGVRLQDIRSALRSESRLHGSNELPDAGIVIRDPPFAANVAAGPLSDEPDLDLFKFRDSWKWRKM